MVQVFMLQGAILSFIHVKICESSILMLAVATRSVRYGYFCLSTFEHRSLPLSLSLYLSLRLDKRT